MRFHPLAVSVVVGTFGSSSIANAFVLPKSGSAATPARMAADSLFDIPNRNDGNNNVDNANKKPKKPNPRTEKLRAKLEADLSAAEESRARAAQQLADAEASRQALEAQAQKAAKEAEAIEAKFNAFQAKEAARAAGGGLSAAGIVGEIAGPLVGGAAVFGGLAAARDSLAARSEKAEEERLQREKEELQAEQAAKRKAAQEAQNKNLLPIVGVAGLGAFGAFFNSGNGGDAVIDVTSTNVEPKVGQQKNAGSVTTSIPDPGTVELPYLDKEIKKVETKQKQVKPFSKMQFGRKATEEEKAMEARLEKKLAEAPELARKAAEAEKKAAEEKKALEAKQAAEKKAAEEKAAEEQAAAEKAKADKIAADKLAFEKIKAEQAAKAAKLAEEEKAKADKIAADKLAFEKIKAEQAAKAAKLAEEEKAKQEKFAADKLAFEKIRAEQQAQEELKAREEEAAAALEMLKEQDAQWKGFIPKVPAVSEILFGDNKPSLITDKGLSNIFSPNLVIVGGVALAGAAVASAVAAANESPSVSSTFKVTGKTPKEYLESGETNSEAKSSPAPKRTIRIPKPEKQDIPAPPDTSKTSPAAGSKEALREELKRQRDNLRNQVTAKEASDEAVAEVSQSTEAFAVEDAGVVEPAFTPPAKKSYSPFGGKPKAVANDPLYPPSTSQSVDQSISPVLESSIPEQNAIEDVSVAMPKKSYSPFGRKPRAVTNDSLYSPPVPTSVTTDISETPTELIQPTTFSDTNAETPPSSFPQSSYSPFGGGKPKAVGNDSLYSPPTSTSTMPQFSEIEAPPEPSEPTVFADASVGTSPTTFPKSSYSPFRGGKPKAAVSDPLYSPPSSYEPSSFANDTREETSPSSTAESDFSSVESYTPDTSAGGAFVSEPKVASPAMQDSSTAVKTSYSPFGQKPFVATDDSLYSPPAVESSFDTAGYEIPESEPTTAYTDDSALPPQNDLSFGDAKPIAQSDDSLYAPPSDQQYDLPFAASGLDDTSGATGPETTAFGAASKKSFSPYGTKPKAPTGKNSGGYLDEL